MACDGRYVFLFHSRGLFKVQLVALLSCSFTMLQVGTGYEGTMPGHVYAEIQGFRVRLPLLNLSSFLTLNSAGTLS